MKHKSPKLLPLGFAIPLVLMVLLVIVGLYNMAQNQSRLNAIVENHNVKSALIISMRDRARERTISLFKMILTEDIFEVDQQILIFHRYGTKFAQSRIRLLKLNLSAVELTILKEQGRITREVITYQQIIIDQVFDSEVGKATHLLLSKSIPAQQAVFNQLSILLNLNHAAATQARIEANSAYQSTRMIMVILSTIAVIIGILVAYVVIQRTRKSESRLFLEKERANVTLDSIADGVITTNADEKITYLNPVAEQLTGWKNSIAKNKNILDVLNLYDEKGNQITKNPVHAAIIQRKAFSLYNLTLMHKNNQQQFSIEQTVGPIQNELNEIIGAVLVFRNVTKIRELSDEIRYQAKHDSLTGLVNRNYLEKQLINSHDATRVDNTRHVLCYFDLDQFKIVNDTCGHAAGNELLKQIVSILQKHIRESDVFARLGGDEFALLMINCPISIAEKHAQTLLNALNDYRFSWENQSFAVSASFGMVPITSSSGTIADVLSAADSACYIAKDAGRNCIHVCQDNDIEITERRGEMQWLPRIEKAITDNQFILYCQQILPLQNNDPLIKHYEILVCLLDEQGKIIPPMAFIPAAERYHMMPAIDQWVINHSFQFIQKYNRQLPNMVTVWAINLSGQSFHNSDMMNFIIQKIDEMKIDPNCLCFEITETAAMKNLNKTTEFMNQLKKIGCFFALDDFGSGLSSFAYLKNLPVDYLKIDGCFVKDMCHDAIDRAMVQSINQIGHTMNIKTIAEFVEDIETLNMLQELGVNFGQGYGIHVPEHIENLLNKASNTDKNTG